MLGVSPYQQTILKWHKLGVLQLTQVLQGKSIQELPGESMWLHRLGSALQDDPGPPSDIIYKSLLLSYLHFWPTSYKQVSQDLLLERHVPLVGSFGFLYLLTGYKSDISKNPSLGLTYC